ncbi:MAG: hypothetical protein KAV82_00535 [Phycisphaerae bacterium]|nr:hypothetical protein [Phycisphaerae bacterium]
MKRAVCLVIALAFGASASADIIDVWVTAASDFDAMDAPYKLEKSEMDFWPHWNGCDEVWGLRSPVVEQDPEAEVVETFYVWGKFTNEPIGAQIYGNHLHASVDGSLEIIDSAAYRHTRTSPPGETWQRWGGASEITFDPDAVMMAVTVNGIVHAGTSNYDLYCADGTFLLGAIKVRCPAGSEGGKLKLGLGDLGLITRNGSTDRPVVRIWDGESGDPDYVECPENPPTEICWGPVAYFVTDCNSNGIWDRQDIAGGTSSDCNTNGVPDECEMGRVLAARWRLDESAGGTATEDVAGLDGTLVNFNLADVWIDGMADNALEFDGANDHVTHGFNLSTNGTISHWLRPDQIRAMVAYYESDGTGSRQNGFGDPIAIREIHTSIGSSGIFFFIYQDGPDSTSQAKLRGPVAQPGIWAHLAVTWDTDSYLIMYVDGVEVDRVAATDYSFENRSPTYRTFGRVGNGYASRHWDGAIDDVQVYDRALTADEIARLAAGPGFAFGTGNAGDLNDNNIFDDCESQCDASQFALLLAEDAQLSDHLGYDVDLSGGLAVAGAPFAGADNAGAAYVFRRVGPGWFQEAKLVADVPAASDLFGKAVAVDGNTIVVGAPNRDVVGADSGAAYVFEWETSSNAWEQTAMLTPVAGQGAAEDWFGHAVAISGDVIVVGALGDGEGATGAGYVFRRTGGAWGDPEAKLVCDPSGDGDAYGYSVAIDGDTIALGGPFVGNVGPVHAIIDYGVVAVFEYDAIDGWQERARLIATDPPRDYEYFGWSVAVSGDTIMASAIQSSLDQFYGGAVYVFDKPAGGWENMYAETRLAPLDVAAQDYFGTGLDLSGETAVMTTNRVLHDGVGSARYYRRENGTWVERAKLVPDDGATDDWFGYAAAIDGDTILVGVVDDDAAAGLAGSAMVYTGLADCNTNGVVDICDIETGQSTDCLPDGIPDECQPDCDSDSIPDVCEFAVGTAQDCNTNAVPDDCDIAAGTSEDCNINGVPDECDVAVPYPGFPKLLDINAAADSEDDWEPQVATDGNGHWVAVWTSNDDLDGTIGPNTDTDILFALSTDNGENWTWPEPLNGNAATDSGTDWSPQLTTDGTGCWVAVWHSDDDLEGTIDPDGDILFAISTNDGADWTAPEPLHVSAAMDSGADQCPQVTTDGNGRWVAVWTSDDDLGGTIGTDQDLLFAVSTDDGANWTTPEPLNGNATTDRKFDGGQQVTTDGNGHWVAVWHSPEALVGTPGADADILTIRFWLSADCNTNGIPDECDITGDTSEDCNTNSIPDECDLSAGTSQDCNTNGVPDECELDGNDCNNNNIPDECDIASGTSEDCLPDGVPDECQLGDTRYRYQLDDGSIEYAICLGEDGYMAWLNQFTIESGHETIGAVELFWGILDLGTEVSVYLWSDPNGDGQPMDAQVLASANTLVDWDYPAVVDIPDTVVGMEGTSFFVGAVVYHVSEQDYPATQDAEATPDRSWLAYSAEPFNPNDLSGAQSVSAIFSPEYAGDFLVRAFTDFEGADCNTNNIPDECDIASGTSEDCNINGIPDECDIASGTSQDCNTNGIPDECELAGNDCNTNGILDECDIALTELAKLLATDGAAEDRFGNNGVAIDGSVAVVGAHQHDHLGADAGAAYVFHYIDGNWQAEARLLASDGAPGDYFGYSVGVSGDVIVVGAYFADHFGSNSGAAYVYRHVGDAWEQEDKLVASDGESGDWLGYSVAVDGDVILVGASNSDDFGQWSGSAYIFRYSGGTWAEEAKLLASDGAGNDFFGRRVALSGDVAVIGSHYNDELADNAGSAYVFHHDGGTWSEEQKLLPADGESEEWFGYSVAVSGDVAVIGAYHDDDLGQFAGSVYVFEYTGSSWTEVTKILADDGEAEDYFGRCVALSGDLAIIGAWGDDELGEYSGSAYIYDVPTADCNEDGIPDSCESSADDCNANGVPDECDIADCVNDPACGDCDGNGVPDGCEYDTTDCNGNYLADECEIAEGLAADINLNGIPDECEDCAAPPGSGDDDGDGFIDGTDYAAFASCLDGPLALVDTGCEPFDMDGDCHVDLADFGLFQEAYTGPSEACCGLPAGCVDLLPEDCTGQGAVPQGPGTDCSSLQCPEACCHPDYTCTFVTPDDCTTQSGESQGPGTSCDPNHCGRVTLIISDDEGDPNSVDIPTGYGDTQFDIEIILGIEGHKGVTELAYWISSPDDDTSFRVLGRQLQHSVLSMPTTDDMHFDACVGYPPFCALDPILGDFTVFFRAMDLGSMVFSQPTATTTEVHSIVTIEAAGDILVGDYRIIISQSDDQPYPPYEPLSYWWSDESWQEQDFDLVTGLTNAYTVHVSVPLEACCLPDGSCQDLMLSDCNSMSGTAQGLGTQCATTQCPQPGACCLPDGSCYVTSEVGGADCTGVYQDDDTTCMPNPCPIPEGACCDPVTDECTVETEADCIAGGGEYQGDDTTCTPNPCPDSEIVYENINFGDPQAPYGPGFGLADDIFLFGSARNLVSYQVGVIGFDGPFDVTAELHTACPMSAETLIAGTTMFQANVVGNWMLQIVDFDLPAPVIIPDYVWVVVRVSTVDAGWVVAGMPMIGFTDDFYGAEFDEDSWSCYEYFSGPGAPYAGFWIVIECEQ